MDSKFFTLFMNGSGKQFQKFSKWFLGAIFIISGIYILGNIKNRRANSQQSHRVAFKVLLVLKILFINFIFTLLCDISIFVVVVIVSWKVLVCSYLPLVKAIERFQNIVLTQSDHILLHFWHQFSASFIFVFFFAATVKTLMRKILRIKQEDSTRHSTNR